MHDWRNYLLISLGSIGECPGESSEADGSSEACHLPVAFSEQQHCLIGAYEYADDGQ